MPFEAPENRLSFKIDNLKFDEDVTEILRIDTSDILSELVEHCSAYAYIASVECDVVDALSDLKKMRDGLHDKLLLGLADEKEARGRNFTAAMQEAVISQNAGMIEANEKVDEVEKISRRLAKLLKAFEMRRDMLAEASKWISRSETPPYTKPDPKDAVRTARSKRVD